MRPRIHRDLRRSCDLNHEGADDRGEARRVQNADHARRGLQDSLSPQVSKGTAHDLARRADGVGKVRLCGHDFEPTDHQTHCPYKGDASYWSIRAGDRVAENAVWSYVNPFPEREDIKGRIAFYEGRLDAFYMIESS